MKNSKIKIKSNQINKYFEFFIDLLSQILCYKKNWFPFVI